MALNQLRAVTNRRIPNNYVSSINAQTPYLPQLYARKESDEYQDKVYDQNERGLAQSNAIALRNEALQRDFLDEQKKSNKKSRNLGYANIALGGATGLANLYQSTQPILESLKPDLSDVTSEVLPAASPELFSEFSTQAPGITSEVANTGDYWDFGGTSDFNVTDLVPDVVKNIGGAIWDAGSSFLDDIGGLFS